MSVIMMKGPEGEGRMGTHAPWKLAAEHGGGSWRPPTAMGRTPWGPEACQSLWTWGYHCPWDCSSAVWWELEEGCHMSLGLGSPENEPPHTHVWLSSLNGLFPSYTFCFKDGERTDIPRTEVAVVLPLPSALHFSSFTGLWCSLAPADPGSEQCFLLWVHWIPLGCWLHETQLSQGWYCCCSVTKSGLTLCDPMDYSTPGLLIPQYLLEFIQIHVHWIGDANPAISSSVTLFSFSLQSFLASGSFLMSWLFISGGQNIGASASASVLPMNIQGWFPLRVNGISR